MALTHDRKTDIIRPGSPIAFPVAAGAVIKGGGLVALNSSGFAVPASADATLTVVGKASLAVDNTGGTDGAKKIEVEQGILFYDNGTAGDAIAQGNAGAPCYASDDHTVNLTSSSGTRPEAGTIVLIRADGQIGVEIAGLVGGAATPGTVTLTDLAKPFGAGNKAVLITGATGTVGAFIPGNSKLLATDAGGVTTALADVSAHAASKTYIDTGDSTATSTAEAYTDAAVSHAIRTIEVTVTHTGTTFPSTAVLPAGAVVHDVQAQASVAYDAGTKFTVGTATHATSLVAATDNFNMDDAGLPLYGKKQITSPANETVLVTLSGASAAGAAVVIIFFSVPLT